MRVSQALGAAAALLAPAALIIIPAGPAVAEWHPCGAITMNPDCHPVFAPPAQPTQPPRFPYTSVTTFSASSADMNQRAVQLPADGSCDGSLAQNCAAASTDPSTSDQSQAQAPADPSTSLHGLLPVASDQAAPAAHHNAGLPMAPVAAAGVVLGGFAAVTLVRRKRHSN